MRNSIYIKISAIAAAAFLLGGCGEYLDVNPKGEVFDKDMFSSSEGYEDALYGVYSELGGDSYAYGGCFVYLPEVLSQNITSMTSYIWGNFARAEWTSAGPTSYRSSMWSNAYKYINHINNIISHVEEDKPNYENIDLYHGEALALRALVHFQLAEFFAPPFWASDEEKKQAIPYVTKYTFDVTPFSSLDEVFAHIISDLKEAESLETADENLMTAERSNLATGFTSTRMIHMNLYAVRALLARVYWVMGDLENAAAYARKVIDSGKFSFRPLSDFVHPDNGTIDTRETIFGFYSQDWDKSCARLFGISSSLATSFVLASDWQSLYEADASPERSDYRLGAWFDDVDRRLIKFVNTIYYNSGDASSYTGQNILGSTILRLPEMYYIMAEYYLSSDNERAKEYYDAVTVTRGMDPIAGTETALTSDMLLRERRREFYGEGLMWLQMKRDGMDIHTASGLDLSGKLTSTYTVQIPDAEYENRNNID